MKQKKCQLTETGIVFFYFINIAAFCWTTQFLQFIETTSAPTLGGILLSFFLFATILTSFAYSIYMFIFIGDKIRRRLR